MSSQDSGSSTVNALAERLATASAAEAGHSWADLDDSTRAQWLDAWRPVATSIRTQRQLPVSDEEITSIVRTQRRIEPAASGPPTRGLKESAQMIIGLRLRTDQQSTTKRALRRRTL